MKNLFSTIFSIFLVTTLCYAQEQEQGSSKTEKKLYKLANKNLADENFRKAQSLYLKLIKINDSNKTYLFEAGLSYYFADFNRTKSIPLFENSLKKSKKDTVPELYYYLGRSYHLNGDYDKSNEAFKKFKPFIDTESSDGQELLKKIDYFTILNTTGNDFLAKKNEEIVITNLGMNSSYGDYAPVIVKGHNDTVLLFTSRRKSSVNKKLDKDLLPFENVYIAQKNENEWEVIMEKDEIQKFIPENLNSKGHDATIIYSSDGRTLYTYKKDAIWKSVIEEGKWSELVQLDETINASKYNVPSLSISKDENTLYFVSHRKDGVGGKDIYKSLKDKEGHWGEATLLSNSINTQLDEDSPFISEDGNTLYFSSKGHKGLGSYDVYRSRLVDGKWSPAENMGIPVNSASDDIYFIIDNIENNGFFASSRNGGIGGMDIYIVCMDCARKIKNTINGLLVNVDNKPINDGEIKMQNVNSDSIIGSSKTKDGKFTLTSERLGNQENLEKELVVNAPNYYQQITTLNLPDVSSETNIKIMLSQFRKDDKNYQVLNLTSNDLGINKLDTITIEKITANPIILYKEFYTYNSSELDTNNPKFTAVLEQAMSKSSDSLIYLSIESSASKVPTSRFRSNEQLATLRGSNAKDFIIKVLKGKGISEDKIIINEIKAIISGPEYDKDHEDLEKYNEFQYVIITIK